MKQCQWCGAEIHRHPRTHAAAWARQVCCSRTCYRRVRGVADLAEEHAARLEEVAFLLDVGERRIAERLGVQPDSLTRWLIRNGHPDTARQLGRIA